LLTQPPPPPPPQKGKEKLVEFTVEKQFFSKIFGIFIFIFNIEILAKFKPQKKKF
jgi:hypothetical protein